MLLLRKFQYHEPNTIQEACEIMQALGAKAAPLAGGTDLLVKMKMKIMSPENVVSLGRIAELQEKQEKGERIMLGAGIKVAKLVASKEVRQVCRALSLGAENLGSPLVRNLATMGGNLMTARPAADLPPGLIAHNAEVVLVKHSGKRTLALEKFILGPGKTAIGVDEILTAVIVDRPPPFSGSSYLKLGIRKALEISLVNVAATLTLEKPGGAIRSARVVMGAVGPVPLRAFTAEKILIGAKPEEILFDRAGEAAAGDSRPFDDFRSSAAYRREIVKVFTRRVLAQAFEEAQSRV